MPKEIKEKYIVCPFFRYRKSGKDNTIRCEGTTEGQTAELVFSRLSKKKEWQKEYCCSFSYLRCPYAKMLDDMWEAKKK